MDSTTQLSNAIKEVINRYAQLKPSHGDIRLDTVFDDEQKHYALMQVGWDRERRVRGNLIYITLQDDRVVIEYDGMECGIVRDLVASGIASDQITLAYQPESQTALYAS
ncbi:MAG: XisI protein [Leptolyngbya sp. SIO4C1]|nr:XisI protein [Leptolyngbya sp. SIO4C1]